MEPALPNETAVVKNPKKRKLPEPAGTPFYLQRALRSSKSLQELDVPHIINELTA